VEFPKVNANLDEFIKKSGLSAASVKAAGDASGNFALAFKKLQVELLSALEPISKLAASINTAGEAFGSFIKIIVQIGTVVASFFILGRAVALVTAGFSAISAGAAAIGTGLAVVVNLFRNFGAVTGQLNGIGGIFVGTLKVLRTYLGDLGAFAVKSIPGLGALGVSLSYVSDYASDAYDKLKQLFGLKDPRDAEAGMSRGTRDPKVVAAEAAAKEAEEEKLRQIKTENQKIASEMQKILQTYKETNAEANKKFALDTAAINQTDKQKLAAQERFAAEKTFNQELGKLQDQINQRRQANTPVDLAVIPALEEAQRKLTQEYQAQKTAIDGLVDSRIKDERAKQVSLFATQSFIGLQLEADKLAERSALQLLPLQARGYLEVELAARRSAEAAIAAEEARRGEKLDPTEAAQYYQAARQGIEGVKTAQDELNGSTEKYNLLQFSLRSQFDLQKKIRDIQHEMSTATLSGIAKKYADIEKAARDAAEAQIQAEEVRTGKELDENQRKAYYETARKGIEELKQAETESYEASRNGLTGLKKALNEYVDDATNAAKNVENVFRKATQGMEDMIVKFAKTGKFEFKEFVNSMLEDLLRSQIRQTMANLFTMSGNQVKGGGGGLFGGSIIPGILAAGGPVSDRRPYIVGERGPELFVPNSAGSMVPNSGLTGGNTVTYNISAVDAMSFKQMIARDPSFIHAVAMQGGRTVPARR
jgi:phage-related minor tail protein